MTAKTGQSTLLVQICSWPILAREPGPIENLVVMQ